MIDKIFYINLERRNDRKKHLEQQINKFNLQHLTERINAIDGNKINIKNISSKLITNKGKNDALNNIKLYIPLTKGAIGCALSHMIVYEKIKTDNIINSALILEDDITFNNKFMEIFNNILPYFPKDYDIIYLGYTDSSIKYFKSKIINNYFIKSSRIYGLFGYIVSTKGAHKLLNIFPITNQLDTEISNSFNKINAYAILPKNKIIHSDPSSIYSKFGTDIQIREHFIYHSNKFDGNFLKIIFIFIFIFIFIYFLLLYV